MSTKQFLATLVLSMTFFAGVAQAASNQPDGYDGDMKPFTCPRDQDDDKRQDAVIEMISKQASCGGASRVYEACAFGNTYTRVELTEPLITVCERSIVRDKSVRRIYLATQKQCVRSGESRQDVAITTQCSRETAQLFGTIVEVVKNKDE